MDDHQTRFDTKQVKGTRPSDNTLPLLLPGQVSPGMGLHRCPLLLQILNLC